jgi:7-cyano-7-deazaguanine synthase
MKIIVLMSGGLDSALCMQKAIRDYGSANILALTFNYQQRHATEIAAATSICKNWGIRQEIIPLDFLAQISTSSLTDGKQELNHDNHALHQGQSSAFKSVVVPGRNALFLRVAAMRAFTLQANLISIGVNEQDSPDFPDCSRSFLDLYQNLLRIDFGNPQLTVLSPIVHHTKKNILEELQKFGVLDYLWENSVTCYAGLKGKGCGKCPSCEIRNSAFQELGIK